MQPTISFTKYRLLFGCFDCQDGEDDAGAQSVTRVGRLVIVDLAGNERLEAWQVKRDTCSRVQMHNQT